MMNYLIHKKLKMVIKMINTTGRVYSIKKFNLLSIKPKDKEQLLFIIIVLIGIITGAFLFSQNMGCGKIAEYLFKRILYIHSIKKQIKVFLSVLLQYMIICITIYIFGVSVIGVVTIPFLILFYGFLTGDLLSYVFSSYELKGIAFNAVILIPPAIIFTIGLIFLAKTTFEFSLSLSNIIIKKRSSTHIYSDFSVLCKKMLITFGFCIGSATADCILYNLFGSYFKF